MLPGKLASMIARRARPRFTVRLEVPRAESLRAWAAVAADFERSHNIAENQSQLICMGLRTTRLT